MREKIESIVMENLHGEKIIRLDDTSSKHAKHGNFSMESHFEIEIDAGDIPLEQKIELHKILTAALAKLYAPNMVHSISIDIK